MFESLPVYRRNFQKWSNVSIKFGAGARTERQDCILKVICVCSSLSFSAGSTTCCICRARSASHTVSCSTEEQHDCFPVHGNCPELPSRPQSASAARIVSFINWCLFNAWNHALTLFPVGPSAVLRAFLFVACFFCDVFTVAVAFLEFSFVSVTHKLAGTP